MKLMKVFQYNTFCNIAYLVVVWMKLKVIHLLKALFFASYVDNGTQISWRLKNVSNLKHIRLYAYLWVQRSQYTRYSHSTTLHHSCSTTALIAYPLRQYLSIVCTILRLPLIVGSNPPGNLGKMINGIKNGFYF